jgi:predicted dehydrogenase
VGFGREVTKVLVVGAGSIGTRHATNAKQLGIGEIGVSDPNRRRRDALAAATGARAFESLESALAWQPTVAIVCTPPALHVEIAQRCAEAGCQLLSEKPLAAGTRELAGLERTLAACKTRAAVAYQLRFHDAVRRLRELATSGAIGRLLSVQAEYGQYLPAWRPSRDYRATYTAQSALGGGILLDASHEIDYVRWIAGEMATVFASVAKLSELEMDAEDTAALVIRGANGMPAEIHLDCVQRGYSRRCVLIGSEATVRWDSAVGLRITDAYGQSHDEPTVPEPNEAYLAELKAFLDGESTLATIADGARVLAVIDASRRSSAERREVAI